MRNDLGALDDLKKSMEKHGLITPITVDQDYKLLAGYRRLRAAVELGWDSIECGIIHVRTPLERFEIEVDENTMRKNFTPDETLKIEERRRELSARGFRKLYYLARHLFRWIKSLFGRDPQ